MASVFLLFLVPVLHARIPRDAFSWGVMVLLGSLQITLVYGLIFWGKQYISSGLTAVLSHGPIPLASIDRIPIIFTAESGRYCGGTNGGNRPRISRFGLLNTKLSQMLARLRTPTTPETCSGTQLQGNSAMRAEIPVAVCVIMLLQENDLYSRYDILAI